jgi:hypothetical protein
MFAPRNRPDGWEVRLESELLSALDRRWTWGEHDCATFAWRCARAILDGETPWDRFMGRWHSEAGALNCLQAVGGLTAGLSAESAPIAPVLAISGDLVIVREAVRMDEAVGVVMGRRVVLAAPHGLLQFDVSAASTAFPVG